MRPLLSAWLCCVALATAAADRASPVAADEAALREIKTVLWPRAYAERDPKLLDRILAAEFQSVDDQGTWSTKAEELDWVARHKPSHDSFVFEIRRLDLFETGTAIVAGTGVIRGKDAQGPYIVEYQSSNVFIKREGRWQAVASHVSGSRRK